MATKNTFFYVFCCCFTRRTLAEYLMEIYSVNKVESHVWMMSGAVGTKTSRNCWAVLFPFLRLQNEEKCHLDDAHHDLAGEKPECDFDPIFVIRIKTFIWFISIRFVPPFDASESVVWSRSRVINPFISSIRFCWSKSRECEKSFLMGFFSCRLSWLELLMNNRFKGLLKSH